MLGDRIALLPRSVLVLGGARSGKSRFAQGLAEASGKAPVLIATATVEDDEMRERVARHRAERGAAWACIEAPVALAGALAREARPDGVVVVDCLTLWLTNIVLAGQDAGALTAQLAATLADLAGPVILVSNEVGAGIVPDNALARAFRDVQGRLNQAMAATCDAVVLVTAGIPQLLKPAAALDIRL